MNTQQKLKKLRLAWLEATNLTDKKIIEIRAKLLTKPGKERVSPDPYELAKDIFND
jgi:hypothetical protein